MYTIRIIFDTILLGGDFINKRQIHFTVKENEKEIIEFLEKQGNMTFVIKLGIHILIKKYGIKDLSDLKSKGIGEIAKHI